MPAREWTNATKRTQKRWYARVACLLVLLLPGRSARAQEPAQIASVTDENSTVTEQKEAAASQKKLEHPHREQRDKYLWGTFGPPGLIGAALSSGFQQWRDSPREWAQTTDGYLKRFTAEYAQSSISDSTKYVIARSLDEDPSFKPCDCTGLMHRLRHASLGPIAARKPDGRIVLSMARVVGMTTGEIVAASTWYPGQQGVSRVATHLAVDFAGQMGVDLLREFFVHHHSGS
jgi:hypothetical protein